MPRRNYKPRRIRKDKLDEGILKCIDNAKNFLNFATDAAQNTDVYAGAIWLSFGVEEYGKALCLKEYLNKPQDLLTVDGAIFEDHNTKLKKAEENLPTGVLVIKPSTYSATSYSSVSYNTEETAIDFSTRLDHLYVNWSEEKQDWTRKPRADTRKLLDCAKVVIDNLSKLRNEIENNR